MCRETPAQGMGLVNTSPQGQLWGIIGNCAGVLAQWKVFFRENIQVGVRGQGSMRASPQVKVGIWANPPVNVGMWTKDSNFKFDFYLFPLSFLKHRVKGSKVSDFWTHWKLFETSWTGLANKISDKWETI